MDADRFISTFLCSLRLFTREASAEYGKGQTKTQFSPKEASSEKKVQNKNGWEMSLSQFWEEL